MCFALFVLFPHFIRCGILLLSFYLLVFSYNKSDNNVTDEAKTGSTLAGRVKFKTIIFITHLEVN